MLRSTPSSTRRSRSPSESPAAVRRGFTLIELLVAIAIIGVLIALILPAVAQVREAARRTECRSHLKQLGVAMHNYHSVHRMFPPGASKSFSVHVFLLPHLEQNALYAQIQPHFKTDPPDGPRPEYTRTPVDVFVCPSDPESDGISALGASPTNYASCFGSGVQRDGFNGMFQHLTPEFHSWRNGPVRARDVTDGLSNTAAMSEILIHRLDPSRLRTQWRIPEAISKPDELDLFADACRELPAGTSINGPFGGSTWLVGSLGETMYNHVLTPNEPSCRNGPGGYAMGAYTASSLHPGGVHVLFGDGRVEFVSEGIDRRTWRAYASRNGGETF